MRPNYLDVELLDNKRPTSNYLFIEILRVEGVSP